MKKAKYSDEAIRSARDLEAQLNSYFGKMGVIGTKCSKLTMDSMLNTGLVDADDYPHDNWFERLVKTPVRAFVNSCRRDSMNDMLDLKRQAEMLFLDHCGLFSEAKTLLKNYGVQAADFRDVLDGAPDFVSLNQLDPSEDYFDELDSLSSKITAFIDRAQAVTESLLTQLEPISSASIANEDLHDETVEDDGFAAQPA